MWQGGNKRLEIKTYNTKGCNWFDWKERIKSISNNFKIGKEKSMKVKPLDDCFAVDAAYEPLVPLTALFAAAAMVLG